MKKNYAIIGTGSRSFMFGDAIASSFKDSSRLAALCDPNPLRMNYAEEWYRTSYDAGPIPRYAPEEFEKMLDAEKIDTVIVTSVDRTHHRYIVRALDAGRDVICEKPMTVDCRKAEEIFRAVDRSGRSVRVTFNYRYAPRNSLVKELLKKKIIGDVHSIHFEWLLDTRHGADYFRRWHRDKYNSGGLMVHKATHHFDLVNWWLSARPRRVYAQGGLTFYGKENAENRGVTSFYPRGSLDSVNDPFALDLRAEERLKGLYYDAESCDGYLRDRNVFDQGISIEDDMSVIVNYDSGAVMSYHLTAYSPWEGYRIGFNGSLGRLELDVTETAYLSGSDDDPNRYDVRSAEEFAFGDRQRLLVRPHWAAPYEVEIPDEKRGGHGGGDERLLEDIFLGAGPDPLQRAADHREGAYSILTGIAANESMRRNAPVKTRELLAEYPALLGGLRE